MVKVKPTDDGQAGDTKALRSYIVHNFPGSELKEENYGELHFQVGCFQHNHVYILLWLSYLDQSDLVIALRALYPP